MANQILQATEQSNPFSKKENTMSKNQLTNMDASLDTMKKGPETAVAKARKAKKEGQGSGSQWRSKTRQSRCSGAVGQDGPVCVKKGKTVQRVARPVAAKMVTEGWSYCPKSVWRASKKGSSTDQPSVAKKVIKRKVVKKNDEPETGSV